MSKLAVEHLEKFISEFKKKDVKFEDLKKYLTVTQQHNCIYVDKISVEPQLIALSQLLKMCSNEKVKEIPTSNKLMKDFTIDVFKTTDGNIQKASIQCRLVKESDVRKADENGKWGVNISSFRYLK